MPSASSLAALSLDEVTEISREIAAEVDARIQVIGVASTDGESGRVELLVTVRGCHTEPCVLMVNVTRVGQAAFEEDVREKFRNVLSSHIGSGVGPRQ